MILSMKVVTAPDIEDKDVLLRLDLDVPLKARQAPLKVEIEPGKHCLTNLEVADDTRLVAGLDILSLCLEYAKSTIIMGHIGRPEGKVVPELSVAPVVAWFEEKFAGDIKLQQGKFHILENLRFERGEEDCSIDYAKELASYGNYFINEAFASHHPAASTTVLPALLPHSAGLRFAKEVEALLSIRNNPSPSLVAIIGGAKIEDKLPVVTSLSNRAKYVLVGGKLVSEIRSQALVLPENVVVAQLDESALDINSESIQTFKELLSNASQVIWSGPLGKFEEGHIVASKQIAEAIIQSNAYSIVGGGDTINCLNYLGLIDKMKFVSVGGGAMLKLLSDGTLPTIQALE